MKAVNLLPSELRGTAPAPAKPAVSRHSGGSGAYVVLGALALSVAGLAGWVLTGNSIDQREAELAALAERQHAAQARAAQLKPYADFAAVATERVSTVQQLAGSRFDWELALRDISYALPADVTVNSVDGSIASTVGGGSSALRGAIESPAIELKGCATDQRAIARMMSRLRAVNGVTRVSLSRTQKADDVEGAAAPVSGTGGTDEQPVGCAGKNPPDFELVMFFESQSALSAEPTVTSGGEAAAQPATAAAQPATGATTPGTGAATATPTPTPTATSTTGTPTSTQGAVTP
jgi:Tfp pilus assembly protein PilN